MQTEGKQNDTNGLFTVGKSLKNFLHKYKDEFDREEISDQDRLINECNQNADMIEKKNTLINNIDKFENENQI